MKIPEGWQKADRPWAEYPIGTKARQSWEGGYWIKTEQGWKWHSGATFPRPGAADQVMLATAPTPPAQGDKPVAYLHEWTEWHPFGSTETGKLESMVDCDPQQKTEDDTVTPLYTRPDNDKLRQAAEELRDFVKKDVRWNHERDRLLANLDTALEEKS